MSKVKADSQEKREILAFLEKKELKAKWVQLVLKASKETLEDLDMWDHPAR